jgi:hypothetical protein
MPLKGGPTENREQLAGHQQAKEAEELLEKAASKF